MDRWFTAKAALEGIQKHLFAADAIADQTVQDGEDTVSQYINDSIRHRMVPEQVLYYSENCYGMADAISFRYRKLRVFDLKTGVTKASVRQLEVYAALFCLEYDRDPYTMKFEFRIYQDDEIRIFDDVDPEVIVNIMDTIVEFDMLLTQLRADEEG